jgi:FKBP-type peptidyl-prolyl cis-trans isomerase
MKNRFILSHGLYGFVFVVSALGLLFGCTSKDGATSALKTDKEKFSYAVGQQIGGSFKSQNLDVDTGALFLSIQDALAGKESRLSQDEMRKAMESIAKQMADKQAGESKKNSDAGEKFLTENKAKPGVKVTSSGLQYEVLTEGKGKNPKATDTVKVHYRGTLIDGTEFDSSYARNEPAEFPLNRVIPGWTEGLQLAKKGGKLKLYIPSNLGYGAQATGKIPANSTLIFEVELLEIK